MFEIIFKAVVIVCDVTSLIYEKVLIEYKGQTLQNNTAISDSFPS